MKNKSLFIMIATMIIAISLKAQQTGTFTDIRDGKIYNTIIIGTQRWMAENLAFKTDINCWAYNQNDSNVINYGYLYNFEMANKVCPVGWHLPSKDEFLILLQNVGGAGENAFNALVPNGTSGFSALFGGMRLNNGIFINIDFGATFWSNSSWYLYLNSGDPMLMENANKANVANGLGENLGFSVRCIGD
jgi:uncharacterized protein (TIGR02145 family)